MKNQINKNWKQNIDEPENEGKPDENVNEPENEHVVLALLIANLKLDVDENKMKHKQLKKANTSLFQEHKKSKQDLFYCRIELKKYKNFQTNHKDKEKAELKCERALGLLAETKRLHNESSKTQSYKTFYVKEENGKFANQISTHESRISQLFKEKEQLKKDIKAREDKDIDFLKSSKGFK
ncbi:hypothetical protein Tco_1168120 [Tanacetum coccineum]